MCIYIYYICVFGTHIHTSILWGGCHFLVSPSDAKLPPVIPGEEGGVKGSPKRRTTSGDVSLGVKKHPSSIGYLDV